MGGSSLTGVGVVSVSPLIPDDLAEVAALFSAHTGRPADLDTMARWQASWPCGAARRADDGALVGYLLCRQFAPDIAEIASLYVTEDARRSGVATGLVRHIEAVAVDRGIGAVVAVNSTGYRVVGDRPSARPLYVGLGYDVLLETTASIVYGKTLGPGR